MVKVRWTGEPRSLAAPQIEVAPGDVVTLAAEAAASLIEQGLAESVADKAPKKENV